MSVSSFWRPVGTAFAAGLIVLPAARAWADSALPAYQPHSVEVPRSAPYVRPDGSIYIVGDDGMAEILAKFNELFTRTHPGFKFTMLLKDSSTGIGGLTAGVSAFAPMGREAWPAPTDVIGFREVYRTEPLDIHIGRSGYGPRRGGKNPPALYVNARNPLPGLTVEQVTRIFTTGAPAGDITHWKQLGLGGPWEKRRIHAYGPRDDGRFATSTRHARMGGQIGRMARGLPFTRNYEPLEEPADVINAVAEDPYGIGLVDFIDADAVGSLVKLVPLADTEGASYYSPTYENVHAGRYPYSPYLRLYAVRLPGKPLDPFVKEYARLALSREGQAIIAALKTTGLSYVPLAAGEVAGELAKLE